MAVSLTYLDDLARVRIDADGFVSTDTDAALVERSTDQVRWATVRGGALWPTTNPGTGDEFEEPLDDYEFDPNVVNHYRVTPIDTGPGDPNTLAGLFVQDATGSYASTPDTASLDITGSIDLRADLSKVSWNIGLAVEYIISKYNTDTDQRSYALCWQGDRIQMRWSEDGSNFFTELSDSLSFADGSRHAIRATLRVDNGAGQHEISFYTADTMDSGWTKLGSTVVNTGTTSIFAGTADLIVNGINDGTQNRFDGTVHEVQVRDVAGTAVAWPIFRNEYEDPFTDEAGLTWNTNSAELTVQVASITPDLQGQVWLKSVPRPFLNRPIRVRALEETTRPTRSGVFDVVGRSLPVAVTDVRSSRRFALTVVTSTRADAKELDFVLASGDPMFLQVPPDVPELHLSQLHCVIDETSQVRVNPHGSDTTFFTLPFIETAAPTPDVHGTTATWQSLINDFGSWSAVVAAFPSWAAVLDYVGSPESVIVP